MYLIGISSGIKHGHHDGAEVLLDGELIAAAQEESFTLDSNPRRSEHIELPEGRATITSAAVHETVQKARWRAQTIAVLRACDYR
ncbi:hypothetical protein LRP30_27520 [Bradyrhizobium sp. C-145]|uniref:hypothetical protein n=1 Tax=Bradyrhizobium sp. C-145 TaxID=574727 RepID=UPI00201B59A7|nr:hypothetical protein [Bradyrhizobium sp. C-145]UQR60735.1 hypothetical protein LRP30_27520 [Bradyrhizobium sp. C-145]